MGRFADIYYRGYTDLVEESHKDFINPDKKSIKEKLSISGSNMLFIESTNIIETETIVEEVLNEMGIKYGLSYFKFNPKTPREVYQILACTYTSEKTLLMTIPNPLLINPDFSKMLIEKANGGRHIHGEHLPMTFDFSKYGVDHESSREWCTLDGNNYFTFLRYAIEYGFPVNVRSFDHFSDSVKHEFSEWMNTLINDPKLTGRTFDDVNWVDPTTGGECASYMDLPVKFFNLSRLIMVVPPNKIFN